MKMPETHVSDERMYDFANGGRMPDEAEKAHVFDCPECLRKYSEELQKAIQQHQFKTARHH